MALHSDGRRGIGDKLGDDAAYRQKRVHDPDRTPPVQPSTLHPGKLISGSGTVRRRKKGQEVERRFVRGRDLFQNFVSYILPSELRLAAVGYALNNTNSTTAEFVWQTAENIVAHLNAAAQDNNLRTVLNAPETAGNIGKSIDSTLTADDKSQRPGFAEVKRPKPKTPNLFRLTSLGGQYIEASQYAYSWLAEHERCSISKILTPANKGSTPSSLLDIIIIETVGKGISTSDAVARYLREGSEDHDELFKHFDHKGYFSGMELVDVQQAINSRVAKYERLGYFAVTRTPPNGSTEPDIIKLTDKGEKFRGVVQSLYDLFVQEPEAARRVRTNIQTVNDNLELSKRMHTTNLLRYFTRNDVVKLTSEQRKEHIYHFVRQSETPVTIDDVFQSLKAINDPTTQRTLHKDLLELTTTMYLDRTERTSDERVVGRNGSTFRKRIPMTYTAVHPSKEFDAQEFKARLEMVNSTSPYAALDPNSLNPRNANEETTADFEEFLGTLLGSELRLAVVGYVLSRKSHKKSSSSFVRKSSEAIATSLEKLAHDEAVSMYLADDSLCAKITETLGDNLKEPTFAVSVKRGKKTASDFQMQERGGRFLKAAEYAYLWLAEHQSTSMTNLLSEYTKQMKGVRRFTALFDFVVLEAVALGNNTPLTVRELLQYHDDAHTMLPGYDHTREPKKITKDGLLHNVKARFQQLADRGLVETYDGKSTITFEGRKLRAFIHDIYGLFTGDDSAQQRATEYISNFRKRTGINPHQVNLRKYFVGREIKTLSELSHLERIQTVYDAFAQTGRTTRKQIYYQLMERFPSLTKTRFKADVQALITRGYLVQETVRIGTKTRDDGMRVSQGNEVYCTVNQQKPYTLGRSQ